MSCHLILDEPIRILKEANLNVNDCGFIVVDGSVSKVVAVLPEINAEKVLVLDDSKQLVIS